MLPEKRILPVLVVTLALVLFDMSLHIAELVGIEPCIFLCKVGVAYSTFWSLYWGIVFLLLCYVLYRVYQKI